MAKGLGDFVLRVERSIIAGVATEVVKRTPVDTGFARGNWRPGINAVPIGTTVALDKTAQASPAKIIAVSTFLRLGDTFYISNNADYISKLASGSSPQAAAGYIPVAVAKGVKKGIALSRAFKLG